MGSIPNEITAFFINIILPAALWPWGSTVPGISHGGRGKGGRFIGLATLPPSFADCLEIVGSSASSSPRGQKKFKRGICVIFGHKNFHCKTQNS